MSSGAPARGRHRRDERAHRAAAVAVDLDSVGLELGQGADVRETARASAREHDAERASDDAAHEPARSRVARLGRGEPVVGPRRDRVQEGSQGVAGGRAEDHEVGIRAGRGRNRAVLRRDEQHAVGLPRTEVAPDSRPCLVEQEHVGVLVLRTLDRVRAGRLRPEQLDRAVELEALRERARDLFQRHLRAEALERDERRARRRCVQPSAGLELGGELPGHRGGEPGVALHELDEPLAAQLEQRRVAHRLHRRGARGTRQERQLADRGARPENAEGALLAVRVRDHAQAAAEDDVQVVGVVSLAHDPVACQRAQRMRVRREGLERLGVRARQERNAGERRHGDSDRAHRPLRRMCRSYASANERPGSGTPIDRRSPPVPVGQRSLPRDSVVSVR